MPVRWRVLTGLEAGSCARLPSGKLTRPAAHDHRVRAPRRILLLGVELPFAHSTRA